jgi:hypothetical protein
MPNSLAPFETLLKHCEKNEIHYRSDADKKRIRFNMWGDGALYKVWWEITGDEFSMDLILPVVAIDEKMRPLVMELLTLANNSNAVRFGHFNLDLSDGGIAFNTSYPIGEAGLEDKTVKNLFYAALIDCDFLFPAIMRVILGGLTPKDAMDSAWLDLQSKMVDNAKTPASAQERPTAKKTRRPRKKNSEPKSRG